MINTNMNRPFNKGRLIIESPGAHTTLQDLGRRGGQHLGFCQSGAADEYSFLWANKLLDNTNDCAVLEIALGQFQCYFDAPTRIAITGAKTDIRLNDKPIYGWQKFDVAAGDRLKISLASQGVYIYLAVHRGFQTDEKRLFNSVAMVPREKSGPFNGGPIREKQSIDYSVVEPSANKKTADYYTARQNRMVSWRYIPDYSEPLTLGLIPGYQFDWMSEASRQALLNETFTIEPESNKMGYRLQGPQIHLQKRSLLSEGIALGAVQVPAEGQPIILLKDRQPVGGYPKIGCISKLDCFMLSQHRPGQTVMFSIKTLEQCEQDWWEFKNFFNDVS